MFTRSLKIDVLQTQFLDPPWSTRSRDLSVPELFFPHHKDDPLAIRSQKMPGKTHLMDPNEADWWFLVSFGQMTYGNPEQAVFWAPEFTGEASKSHVQQLFC